MNIKIPLLLLLALPVLAEDSSPPVIITSKQIENCVNYAMNYSLFVYVAQITKDEKEYKTFIEAQIANQPPQFTDLIHKFGDQAWQDRKLPPVLAGMSVFKQCESILLNVPPIVGKKNTII